MKCNFLFLTLLVTSMNNAFAQKNLSHEKFFKNYVKTFSEDFGILIEKPEHFTLLEEKNTAVKIRKDKDKGSGSAYGPVFLSNDKDCLAMYSAYAVDDSRMNPDWKKNRRRRIFPRGNITAELKTSLGLYYEAYHPLNDDTTKIDFNKYVTVISGKKADKMFNADSIYIYNLPGADSMYIVNEELEQMRSRDYPYCTGMFIYKKGRGIMDVKFFFTEKGKETVSAYINMLRKKIWYKRVQRFLP